MLVVVAGVLAALSALLLGGRPRWIAAVHLRGLWLPPVALALQVLIINVVPRAPHLILATIHVGTYVMAAAFIWLNRSVPGVLVIAAGAALNGVTIALNGGTLPASARALRMAGWHFDKGTFSNSDVMAHARLPWLGDVFAWPSPLPLHNVFSVGDVVIVLGIGYAAHVVMQSRLALHHRWVLRARRLESAAAGAAPVAVAGTANGGTAEPSAA